MAKRRNNLLVGLGAGLTNVSDMLLRSHLQDRSQDRYDKRAREGQEAILNRQGQLADAAEMRKVIAALADGADPASAAAQLALLSGKPVDTAQLEGFRPSPRRRMQKTGERIDAATKPGDVPTDYDIASDAQTAGIGSRFPGLPDFATEGMEPASGPLAGFDPLVTEFGHRAARRRTALESEPTATVDVELPSGAKERRFVSKSGGPVQTTPNAQQQGVIAANKKVAEESTVLGNEALQTLKGKTEARLFNLVEGLTRQAKVATAAAEAGAAKRAGLAPDIVASEVDRSQRLAAGKENSTESERRAATNWAPLVKAHDLAMQMEKDGAAIGLLDPTLSKWPIANRAVSEQSQQYMQAARDFISTLGLIRSGVTVRPDEAESLFATMFRTEGEGPQQLQNKQRSREVFLASMQAMVGRSGDEAGRILAAAINQGQISPQVLESLQFDNQQLKDALLKNLRGVPLFDLSGQPIGVRR